MTLCPHRPPLAPYAPALLVLLALAAPARAQLLVDDSAALEIERFSFRGGNGDPYPEARHGNENYYDGDFADLDGDGLTDRVLGARYGALINTGGGYMMHFAGRTGFRLRGMTGYEGWGEDSFQTLDLDNDGDYDVMSGGNNGETFAIQQNRNGAFPVVVVSGAASTIGTVLTDANGDGHVDVFGYDGIYFMQRVHLLINDGAGQFVAGTDQFGDEAAAHGLSYRNIGVSNAASADVDGDGDYDLLLLNGGGNDPAVERVIDVALNDGTGNYTLGASARFAEHPTGGPSAFNQAFATGDIDDDGDVDLVVTRGGNGSHPRAASAIFLNDGHGVFTDVSASNFVVPDSADLSVYTSGKVGGNDGKLFDIDYDGDLDYVIASRLDSIVPIYLNDGSGVFTYAESETIRDPGNVSADGTLGGDCDIADVNGDGSYDVWVGRGGAEIRVYLNTYRDPSGLPADVPRNLRVVQASDAGVTLRFAAPPFASAARYYEVYRATSPGLEGRDRERIHVIGQRHQDEGFSAAVDRHTTTEYLGDPQVALYGASDEIEFTDDAVDPGVTYYYTVVHVGTENQHSAHTAEVLAQTSAPDGSGDTTPPRVHIVSPTIDEWSAYPRIVAHYSDGGSGIDVGSVSVRIDRAVGGRAAGAELVDLAYRLDGGALILPLQLPVERGAIDTVTVSVSDNAGNTSETSVSYSRPPGMDPDTGADAPQAAFSASASSGDAPIDIDFDGSASADGGPVGGLVYRWEWYFGDGSTALGRQVSHRFSAGGDYDVMLLVRDNSGAIATTTQSIHLDGPAGCNTGATMSCYDGPAGSQDVGACHAGLSVCANLSFGACGGQVSPLAEICDDGVDNDCDGATDDGDEDCGGAGVADAGQADAAIDAGSAGAAGSAADGDAGVPNGTAGGASPGGSGGQGASGDRADADGDGGIDAPDASAASDDDGCGCRAPGRSRPPGSAALALMLYTGLLAWRTRRRR